MGMEKLVPFTTVAPSWENIQREASKAGVALTVRMIDNLPAFPDEIPEPGWKELRVASAEGMMSLRQQPGVLAVIVWGNADQALQRDWAIVADACARAVEL